MLALFVTSSLSSVQSRAGSVQVGSGGGLALRETWKGDSVGVAPVVRTETDDVSRVDVQSEVPAPHGRLVQTKQFAWAADGYGSLADVPRPFRRRPASRRQGYRAV